MCRTKLSPFMQLYVQDVADAINDLAQKKPDIAA